MIFIQKMSITMGNFRTKVNFSNQIKEYTNTEGTFSGSVYINQYTILGTDYSNLPLGLDNSTTGVTYFVSPIITDTFTGTTGSTTFYFSDNNMYLGTPYLSAITPSNTGITQNIFVTQPTYSTTIDGNNFDVYFSGVSYDLTATDIVEYSTGLYSGSLVTDFLLYVSGTTYPWWFLKSGSTTWNEIKGRTKTDRLTITNSASTGYVLTCMDNEGNAAWQSFSSITGFTSGDCISDFYVSNLHGCSPITVWDQFQHTTCSATGQSSNAFGEYTYSYGDYSNSKGYNTYAIGNYSHAEGNYPDRDANMAIGDGSHAEGTETTSNGFASHAEGDGSTANGAASHSEGFGTTSDGGVSHAEGHTTNSIGIASHTEGRLTVANGDYSHAEGYQSNTYGLYSHAEGNQTKTYAPYSHSEGQQNISGLVYLNSDYVSGSTGYLYIDTNHGDVTPYFQNGDDLFISDVNSNKNFLVSSYQYTVTTVSYQEISPSVSGTVISINTDPGFSDDLGGNLIVGNLTTPLLLTISNSNIFDGSHTEGSNNISFGLNSHAEGYLTVSYGEGSHSQGRLTKSIGDYSFSSGFNTYSDGNNTFIHSTNSHIKNSNFASILGGNGNIVENVSTNSGIFSGGDGTINSSSQSSIIGGSDNTLIDSTNSVIIGGDNNIINNLTNVVILGTNNKTALNNDTVYVPDLVITPITIPTSSGDTVGEVGSISWDDTHFYIKTNTGWGRISLDYGF